LPESFDSSPAPTLFTVSCLKPNWQAAATTASPSLVTPAYWKWPETGHAKNAIAAGVCSQVTQATTDIDHLFEAAEIGFPIFAKAVAGGGGRGMRRVETMEELRPALEAAMREAESAIGDGRMFLEQAVLRPRHATGTAGGQA
jgi:hypothetical protein